MLTAPIPPDEEQRLVDLRALHVLLTEPEEVYDTLTRDLARIFDVPVVVMSFIDHDMQYHKSAVGLPVRLQATRTEPRELSICSHVVGNNDVMVVEDLLADDRFRDNPIVVETGARFYAGAPLRADSGRAVGSLCIVDRRPRTMTSRERELLWLVAQGVVAQVKLQVASRELLDRTLQIERDLAQAVQVQRFLLPPQSIDAGAWRLRSLYRPVTHLGGDLVAVERRRDGRFALLVADVTGHGTSAALTAAMLKTAFGRAVAGADGPAALLTALQDELTGVVAPSQFITAVTAFFDGEAGTVVLSSAGHPHPLRVSDAGAERIEHDNEFPLLVVPEHRYTQQTELTLSPSDRLLLYTDGATEAADPDHRMLTVAGLGRLAHQAAQDHPDRFLEAILRALTGYAQDRLADDVALLAIEPG